MKWIWSDLIISSQRALCFESYFAKVHFSIREWINEKHGSCVFPRVASGCPLRTNWDRYEPFVLSSWRCFHDKWWLSKWRFPVLQPGVIRKCLYYSICLLSYFMNLSTLCFLFEPLHYRYFWIIPYILQRKEQVNN